MVDAISPRVHMVVVLSAIAYPLIPPEHLHDIILEDLAESHIHTLVALAIQAQLVRVILYKKCLVYCICTHSSISSLMPANATKMRSFLPMHG